MTQTEPHASLDKMLENPKSKNFLNHLVRSYLPVSNVKILEETPKGAFKCALTRDTLVSKDDILKGMQTEQFKTDFMNNLKTIFDEKVDLSSPMIKLMNEKKLGVTGKETTTYMSYPAYQEFYNWIIAKSFKGDKHINWLLGSIRRASFVDRAETIQDDGVRDKIKNYKKQQGDLTTTFTLGDACGEALAKLRVKLEENEKK